MAGEIVFVHVGGCGLRLGAAIWDRLEPAAEGPDPLFTAGPDGARPRAVFVDLDPAALAAERGHPALAQAPAEAWIAGAGGTSSGWSDGYAAAGVLEATSAAIRREVDGCAALQGFVVVHGMAGGTGGGLGARVVEQLRADYPRAIVVTFSVLSALNEADPGSALCQARSLAALNQRADLTFLLGNDAVDGILFRRPVEAPTHGQRNDLFAQAITSVIYAWCSPTGMNLRDMAVTARPFQQTNHLALAHVSVPPAQANAWDWPRCASAVFGDKDLLVAIDPRHGKHLALLCLLQGDVTLPQAQAVFDQQITQAPRVTWIWDTTKVRVSGPAPAGAARSATLIATTTALQETLKYTSGLFRLARRTATADAAALEEANAELEACIDHYQRAQDLGPDGTPEVNDEAFTPDDADEM